MGKQIFGEMTPSQRDRFERIAAAAESAEGRAASDEHFRLARGAAEEESFSGELRRAIHGNERTPAILRSAGVGGESFRNFMMRKGTLPSDAIDRLCEAYGLHLQVVGSAAHESE